MARASQNLIAAALHCQDCEKSFEKKNAAGLAAQHHKRTGHKIVGELVYSYEYPADFEESTEGID